VNKSRKPNKVRTLELKRETIVHLSDDALENVVGGKPTTVKSQCATLCF
jgi:hypothetical protein